MAVMASLGLERRTEKGAQTEPDACNCMRWHQRCGSPVLGLFCLTATRVCCSPFTYATPDFCRGRRCVGLDGQGIENPALHAEPGGLLSAAALLAAAACADAAPANGRCPRLVRALIQVSPESHSMRSAGCICLACAAVLTPLHHQVRQCYDHAAHQPPTGMRCIVCLAATAIVC